jgi:hypothetical protein
MIVSIVIGRKNSKGLPKKNLIKINNVPLMAYPIISAKKTTLIDKVYICSDSNKINNIGKKFGAEIIQRPNKLASDKALGEDVFKYCYDHLKKKLKNIEIVVLLFCNTLCLNEETLNKGIKILKKKKNIDSVVSVSKYNMWSPLRARKINKNGLLDPFVPFKNFGNPKTLNCDRDSQGDVWFADMGFSIVRPHCLENMNDGLLPQKWMGKKIFPFKQEAGFDLDYEWQLPGLKYWNKKYRKD